MFKGLIYEIKNNLHQLTTHLSTLIMWHNRFSEEEKRLLRHMYHDIEDQKATTSRFKAQKTMTSRNGDN